MKDPLVWTPLAPRPPLEDLMWTPELRAQGQQHLICYPRLRFTKALIPDTSPLLLAALALEPK